MPNRPLRFRTGWPTWGRGTRGLKRPSPLPRRSSLRRRPPLRSSRRKCPTGSRSLARPTPSPKRCNRSRRLKLSRNSRRSSLRPRSSQPSRTLSGPRNRSRLRKRNRKRSLPRPTGLRRWTRRRRFQCRPSRTRLSRRQCRSGWPNSRPRKAPNPAWNGLKTARRWRGPSRSPRLQWLMSRSPPSCPIGSPGWNRTASTRNNPPPKRRTSPPNPAQKRRWTRRSTAKSLRQSRRLTGPRKSALKMRSAPRRSNGSRVRCRSRPQFCRASSPARRPSTGSTTWPEATNRKATWTSG